MADKNATNNPPVAWTTDCQPSQETQSTRCSQHTLALMVTSPATASASPSVHTQSSLIRALVTPGDRSHHLFSSPTWHQVEPLRPEQPATCWQLHNSPLSLRGKGQHSARYLIPAMSGRISMSPYFSASVYSMSISVVFSVWKSYTGFSTMVPKSFYAVNLK